MENVALNKNTERSRYEAVIDGQVAGYIDYVNTSADVVQLPHTLVDHAWEGKGIGSKLTRFAIDDIADQNRRVDPLCPFIVTWLKRHPEYAPMVAVNRERGAKS